MLQPESDRPVDSPVTEERNRGAGAVRAPNVVLYCLPGYLDHVPSLVRELSKRVELRVVFEVSRTAWDSNLLGLPRPPFPPGLWPCRDFLREHLPPAVYSDLAGAKDLRVAMYATRAGSDVLVTTRAVRRWFKHISPDLIHFDGESVRPLLWLRSVRSPSVVSVHEPRVPSHSGYTQLRIAKRALVRRSKRVVVHSHAAESALLRTFGIPRDRVAVVPLGVTEVFAQWPVADPDTTERGDGGRVLFFGRLTPRKGLSVFIAAAESVARQKSHVEFAVAGRPERGLVPPSPPRLANDCTLVMNCARLAPADVAYVVRWADIVVVPYLESTQSGVVLTAYAFGKPVVASRVGGLAEQVIDGVTGILVPPGDVSALAAAMLELLDSPGRRRRMAGSIAVTVANELSWARHCERLVSVYAGVLQSASSASDPLVQRYRRHYRIHESAPVGREMILAHWTLERRIAQTLRESTPGERAQVFADGYSELYGQLGWLSQVLESPGGSNPDFALWSRLVGGDPSTVYEVGSGNGQLLVHLAREGHRCRGSEITSHRGEALAPDNPNLTWGTSDGVHLADFEAPGTYDVVISNQVVEHLHPEDVSAHLRGAWDILRPGGRYIFATPHKAFGPSDVSAIFGCDTPMGLHLREYSWSELVGLSRGAGFVNARAVRVPPHQLRRGPMRRYARPSGTYLRYLRFVERWLERLPDRDFRRSVAKAMRIALFPASIWLVLEKPKREQL